MEPYDLQRFSRWINLLNKEGHSLGQSLAEYAAAWKMDCEERDAYRNEMEEAREAAQELADMLDDETGEPHYFRDRWPWLEEE